MNFDEFIWIKLNSGKFMLIIINLCEFIQRFWDFITYVNIYELLIIYFVGELIWFKSCLNMSYNLFQFPRKLCVPTRVSTSKYLSFIKVSISLRQRRYKTKTYILSLESL